MGMCVGSCVLQHACGGQRLTCRHWLVLSFHCGGSRLNSDCVVCQNMLRREHSLPVCYWMLRISVFPSSACPNTGTQPMWSYSVMDSPTLWRCVCFCQGGVCEVPVVLCDLWSFVLKSITCLPVLGHMSLESCLNIWHALILFSGKNPTWQRGTGDIYKWFLKCTFLKMSKYLEENNKTVTYLLLLRLEPFHTLKPLCSSLAIHPHSKTETLTSE